MKERTIRLFDGSDFAFEDPNAPWPTIETVAHSLGQLPRFLGHQRNFVSVAEHCVLVSEVLEHELRLPGLSWAGLMHDAHEALSGGDVPGPMKNSVYFHSVKTLEAELAARARAHWYLPAKLNDVVKRADRMVMRAEAEQNLNGPMDEFECGVPAARINLRYWDWRRAKREFVKRAYRFRPGPQLLTYNWIEDSAELQMAVAIAGGASSIINFVGDSVEFAALMGTMQRLGPASAACWMERWVEHVRGKCFAFASDELELAEIMGMMCLRSSWFRSVRHLLGTIDEEPFRSVIRSRWWFEGFLARLSDNWEAS